MGKNYGIYWAKAIGYIMGYFWKLLDIIGKIYDIFVKNYGIYLEKNMGYIGQKLLYIFWDILV